MTDWIDIDIDNPAPIVLNNDGDDPIAVYRDRYVNHPPDVDPEETVRRQWLEILSEFDASSHVLLFGSGHSYWANEFLTFNNIASVSVLDYIKEASFGLNPGVAFYCEDILTEGIKGKYDYVYSSHTVEHFTAEQVLNEVLPTCLAAAKKAVIFLVPYGTNWSDEECHKCLFYENDELAARASKYKIIRDGLELVLWFDVEG